MKRRFEEKRIDRLQQLVNEVVSLSGMEEDAVEVQSYRYVPKILFNMFMFFEIFCLLSLNLKIKGIFRLLVDWYEGNQQSVRNALEVVARADEELAKWEQTPSAGIPHEVKALKYHLEELRLDYDL